MKLTDTAVRKAKSDVKPYKMPDGGGMYLHMMPNGSKYWRMDYRFAGKKKTLALGVYPDVSLALARERRTEARKLLANGADPSEVKKAAKVQADAVSANCFEAIAREWLEVKSPEWASTTAHKANRTLVNDIFPSLGKRPILEINPPEVLRVLRAIEAREAFETAKHAKILCGQIFRYAVATGKAERDPTPDLRGALKNVRVKHHAAITDPIKVGELLRAIDAFEGSFVVKCALKLCPLVFLRQGELRQASWSEINFDTAQWLVPENGGRKATVDGERVTGMKMNEPHIVLLSKQAIAILRELQQVTGAGRFIFPSARSPLGSEAQRPMSENAIRCALRAMGYANEDMTPHGFRTMASTLLDNNNFDPKLIERQLAHCEKDAVKAAYKREMWKMYLPDRMAMMQWWADYLDKLKAGAEVIPFNKMA